MQLFSADIMSWGCWKHSFGIPGVRSGLESSWLKSQELKGWGWKVKGWNVLWGHFNPGLFNLKLQSQTVRGHFNPRLFNPRLFNPRLFNPGLSNYKLSNPGFFNLRIVVGKSGVEKSGVEKLIVEKSGVEKSGVGKFMGWKVQGGKVWGWSLGLKSLRLKWPSTKNRVSRYQITDKEPPLCFHLAKTRVYESSSDGKVFLAELKKDKAEQLWKKENIDTTGYFLLRNFKDSKSGSKFLTATRTPRNSPTILTIKGNITLRWIICWLFVDYLPCFVYI